LYVPTRQSVSTPPAAYRWRIVEILGEIAQQPLQRFQRRYCFKYC
jgi:hypothetical protein